MRSSAGMVGRAAEWGAADFHEVAQQLHKTCQSVLELS